jgi:predicted enzyme related to lactoylglutathione lyase
LIYVLTKTTTVFILKIIEMLFTPTLQIAIGTDDVYKTAEAIKLSTGKLTREPGPLPGINTKITACLDPDGWKTVCPLNLMI